MFLRTCCLLTLLLWGAVPASGDFYRYTDARGTMVFTDDLNKVPEDRRDHVQTFESPPAGGQAGPRVSPELQRIVESSAIQATEATPAKAREESAEDRLAAKKQAYQKLIEERERLLEQKRLLDIRYNTRKRKSVTRANRQEVGQRIDVVEDLINNFKW